MSLATYVAQQLCQHQPPCAIMSEEMPAVISPALSTSLQVSDCCLSCKALQLDNTICEDHTTALKAMSQLSIRCPCFIVMSNAPPKDRSNMPKLRLLFLIMCMLKLLQRQVL